MAIIAFVSPKGGVGKTTSCMLMASVLLDKGYSVHIIDADPNRPFDKWQERGGGFDGLTISVNKKDEELVAQIKEAEKDSAFVLIDVEGTNNLKMTYSAALADLCIIPTQRSLLDADLAGKALKLISNAAEMAGNKAIKTAVVLNRTSSAIRPRSLETMKAQIQSKSIKLFETELIERETFKRVFDESRTLGQLQETSKTSAQIAKARSNASSFVFEALEFMGIAKKRRAA